MGLGKVILCVLVVFLGYAACAATAVAPPKVSEDELAIRALMEKINVAINSDSPEKGVEIMRAVLSDKSCTVVLPRGDMPSEAIVADKKAFCEALAQSLRDGPRWGTHEVRQITIVGPIAYEIGESRGPNQAPETPGTAWLNVFAKEDVGWKLVFSTPAAAARRGLRRPAAREGESAK